MSHGTIWTPVDVRDRAPASSQRTCGRGLGRRAVSVTGGWLSGVVRYDKVDRILTALGSYRTRMSMAVPRVSLDEALRWLSTTSGPVKLGGAVVRHEANAGPLAAASTVIHGVKSDWDACLDGLRKPFPFRWHRDIAKRHDPALVDKLAALDAAYGAVQSHIRLRTEER
jgi:hypothetical protein